MKTIKNIEKLYGFKISYLTPIEVIYDLDFNIIGYFFLTVRENYPFQIYIKMNAELDEILEVYPIHLCLDKKDSFKIYKDKKSKFKTDQLFARTYFSYDLNTESIDEDYTESYGNLMCFKNGELKTTYERLTENIFDRLYDEKIKEFLKNKKANYAVLYFDKNTDKLTKFFAGFSFSSEGHREVANAINLRALLESFASS